MEWSFYVGPTIFIFLYFFHTSYTLVDSYYIEFFYFVKFDNVTPRFGMEGVDEFTFGLIATIKGQMHNYWNVSAPYRQKNPLKFSVAGH
jgi:hypothetical protein